MDQNQIPSSPLQHHRSSSPHHNAKVQDGSAKPETSKLAPSSSGFPRPQSNLTTAPNPSSSMPVWSKQEDTPSVSYVDSHTQQGEIWRSQHNGESSWSEGSRSQPMASSSRCPSPTGMPIRPSKPLQPTKVTHLAHLTSSAGSLCTSEPLNRSSSSQSDSLKSAPMMRFARSPKPKRPRASSLPESAPLNKRSKSLHVPDEPLSEASSSGRRLYIAGPRERQYASQEVRAEELRRAIRRAQQKSRTPDTPTEHSIIRAAYAPPINLVSLRPLDAGEIMKNPQLRHDLLFDSLAFRPINSSTPTLPAPTGLSNYVEVCSTTVQTVMSPEQRISNAVADIYWETLAIEIETGCRCVRWDTGIRHERRVRIPGCECGGWLSEGSETEWWAAAKASKWPSRLPEVIETLRQILITLMGSTTPCSTHFAHSFDPEARASHEATCPTITHALVPELYNALDPEFITIQVRRGVFGLGIFEMLGEAMKVHCAPVRDEMVDEMVRIAFGSNGVPGNVGLGLRKCFDCVEIMKLDIANHQVHALRPYLWNSAVSHEQHYFESILASSQLALEESLTRDFIREASHRVVMASSPQDRSHIMGRCGCKSPQTSSRMGLVCRSLAEGWVGLIFGHWSKGPSTVKEPGLRPSNFRYNLPESVTMDSKRISHFFVETRHIIQTQMLLLAFRDLLVTSSETPLTQNEIKEHIEGARADISFILASHPGGFLPPRPKDLQSPKSTKIQDLAVTVNDLGDYSDIALRLAVRIVGPSNINENCQPHQRSSKDLQKVSEIGWIIDNYIADQIHSHLPLYNTQLSRLENAISILLTDNLLGLRFDPTNSIFDPSDNDSFESSCPKSSTPLHPTEERLSHLSIEDDLINCPQNRIGDGFTSLHVRWLKRHAQLERTVIKNNGLEMVGSQVRELVSRISKVAGFNLSAFADIYAGKGMMIGS